MGISLDTGWAACQLDKVSGVCKDCILLDMVLAVYQLDTVSAVHSKQVSV